jgi:hypothetical protein
MTVVRGTVLALAGLLLAPGPAQAADGCARAYERAQEQRVEGKLRAAQGQLLGCSQMNCAPFIRSDCARWLAEVQAAQPTVVFAARQGGRDLDQVTVTCDGERMAAGLDGRAVDMDPGKHSCRFEAAGALPAAVELLVMEGQKSRVVQVDIQTGLPRPQLLPEPVPLPPPRPRPAVGPWVLAGVGALGLAGFAALGLSGLNAEHRLEEQCAPSCPARDVGGVRSRYLLADVSLGIGVVSAAAAAALLWGGRENAGARVALGWPGGPAVAVASSF